ncbi:sugar phosphate isomerase/epimerase [Treponema parvum]|uniref:Sugar phosphate isomerase/epimerase n=1 Tax=Treponema parvum TaxID=138851 RepID=A0A975IEE1_9SPIR|nr:sugar phosphate isomerase/epimerase [Treponema parvum]QTQ13876.1 sugar phosphate isomerase/epimerase [Treponema parvum]
MKIGTMTSQFRQGRHDDPPTSYIEQLRFCKEAGYSVIDLNMCAMSDGSTELNKDDWERSANEIRMTAEKLSLVFSQSHPPYRKTKGGAAYEGEEEEHYRMLTERSLKISAIAGVKWAVLHPGTELGDDMLDIDANIELNHQLNDSFVELAEKLGIGIAFENMRDTANFRRFGSSAEELTSLVDSYKSTRVGACWDFGHANRNMHDQKRAIKLLGKRLKATHVNDNSGNILDEHTIPFMGNIDWKSAVSALREINYEGDLIYELSVTKNMPMELKVETMKFAKKIGEYLLLL